MAHTVFFRIVSVVVAGTLSVMRRACRQGEFRSLGASAAGSCLRQRHWLAKCIRCAPTSRLLSVSLRSLPCAPEAGSDSLTVGNVTSALLSNIVIDAAYTLMVAVAYEVFRIIFLRREPCWSQRSRAVLLQRVSVTVLPPVHMAYWMRACRGCRRDGSDGCMRPHAVIVSLAC